LYKNKAKYLLDSSSNLIFFENNMNFNQLPSVFGIGAENYFVYFFNQLENNNFPIEDIKKIKSLNNPNIEGVIIGKAIYDGDIQISDLAKLI